VVVQVGERDFAGRAEGVTATGALTVDLDGEYRQFHGGVVSLRWSGDESLRESE
jgi:biotin-(acetyl-CoA carboxylase) ligase